MNLSPYGRNVTLFELSIVLRSLSVLWTFGFASLCWHNSPIRYASWAKHSHWGWIYGQLDIGYGLWVIGYGQLVIGYWIWAAKPHIRAFTPYTLRFTPKAIATLPLASNLSPYRFIAHPHSLPLRQCFDADAKQMQERYEIARVKTSEEFEEHYISTIGR